ALLAGILLGDDSRLPQPLSQAFKDTGTAHIIAISGFNIAILAGLLAVLFSRLAGPRWGAALTAVGIGLYTVLVGAGASVVRAAIMGSLGLLASQVGRRQVGLNTLGATALAMFLIRPLWAWDAGFQLSFFATLGLILYARPLQEGFVRLAGRILPNGVSERAADAVGEYLLFTLAAEIFTLPIQVTQFGRLSLAAVAANPLVLPAQPAVMILGGLATLIGLVAPPLGKAAAMLAWPFVAYTIRVVEWLAGLPFAAVTTGPVSPWIAAAWIALAIIPAIGMDRLRPAAARVRGWVKPALLAAGLAAAALLIWRTALVHLDHRLRLSLVGGQAQAALLIQAPSGQAVLVDGGSSADQLSRAIGQRLAPFDRRTAALVITAAGRDSIASLPEVIDQYPPDLALWAADPGSSASALAVQGRLAQRKIPASQARPGDRLDLGDGILLTILGDPGADPSGVLVSWRSFRALLPLVKPARLPAQAGPVSLLILPDRLLKEAPAAAWQSRFQPVEILVNGSSATSPPENLRSTARNGWIQASTDGNQLWLDVERE
ncbi:MAG TPA: ComEC/Rec2 family competence protein, partial [Anaerolineaceae bacterium]